MLSLAAASAFAHSLVWPTNARALALGGAGVDLCELFGARELANVAHGAAGDVCDVGACERGAVVCGFGEGIGAANAEGLRRLQCAGVGTGGAVSGNGEGLCVGERGAVPSCGPPAGAPTLVGR